MLGMMISGLAVTVLVLLTLARMNIRRWLGYAGIVDVAFTGLLLILFAGTFSGVVAAAFSGIWMSVLLQVLRKTLGVERFQFQATSWRNGFVRCGWAYYSPAEITWFGFKKELTA